MSSMLLLLSVGNYILGSRCAPMYNIIIIMRFVKTGRMVQIYKCNGQAWAQEHHGDIKFCILETFPFKRGKR
jgi:hypothetical protein